MIYTCIGSEVSIMDAKMRTLHKNCKDNCSKTPRKSHSCNQQGVPRKLEDVRASCESVQPGAVVEWIVQQASDRWESAIDQSTSILELRK